MVWAAFECIYVPNDEHRPPVFVMPWKLLSKRPGTFLNKNCVNSMPRRYKQKRKLKFSQYELILSQLWTNRSASSPAIHFFTTVQFITYMKIYIGWKKTRSSSMNIINSKELHHMHSFIKYVERKQIIIMFYILIWKCVLFTTTWPEHIVTRRTPI